MKNKLYSFEVLGPINWNETESGVVCASNKEIAHELSIETTEDDRKNEVQLTYIGEAHENLPEGIICTYENTGF